MANFDTVSVLRFNRSLSNRTAKLRARYATNRNLHCVNTPALEFYLLA